MICPKCGNEVQDGKKFCGKCGAKLETAGSSGGAVCSKCGAPLTPGKKFCGKCGTPVAGVQAQDTAKDNAEIVMSAGFAHWNILPGQLAVKLDEKDFESYKDIKGFVVQDGLKALFFADGTLAGELTSGKYPFTDLGIEQTNALRRFFKKIAAFFKGKAYNLISEAASVIVVLVREGEFPLMFVEKDIPTSGIRAEVAVHAAAKISNIVQFYKNQLLDKKFVSFEKFSQAIEPSVRTILEENLSGIEAESISANAQIRETVLSALQQNVSAMYSYISVEHVIRLTATNAELEQIRQMREELYISEKELVELSKRNDFLNRLNDEKIQQTLHEAQTQADFNAAIEKIDEQNQLTEDEKAKFADMLFWQRKLREAQSADEGNAALSKLEQNGLLREEELATLKADIEQRKNLKDLTDGQALAMLTLQNNIALDQQKFQWEIEIGNRRFENQMERQRKQDEYEDERRRSEINLDKEEQQSQLDLLKQAQAIRQEREDAEHRRKMEEEKLHVDADLEKNRIYAGMTAEQIMAANPNISEAAAAALAEKFKSENSQAQIDMANKHTQDIERIMAQNAAQQNATMQQMMQMMTGVMAGQQKTAEAQQDRMTDVLKASANAAYSAAGKIYAKAPENPQQQNSRVNINLKKDATVCLNCGEPLEEGSSFCGECGAAV